MLWYTRVLTVFVAMSVSQGVPNVRLNNGISMPALALGTYLGIDQNALKSKDIVRTAILSAIETGYRHIDTATIYETETEIGDALRSKFESGEVKREDIFITTKLWNTKHKREEVPQALGESLQKLGLQYVDLYLIHWPMGLNADYTYSDVDFMETWRGMEDVLSSGLTRAIGVSNFNKEQLERLLAEGRVPPAVLQIEIHPNMVQADLAAFCYTHNIMLMGYSPLGTTVPRFGTTFPGLKMDDARLLKIAEKTGKTGAQVLLRWQVDRNIVPVIKSLNTRRLKENIDIFDFKLTNAELSSLSIDSNSTVRLILPSFWQDHKYYPFEKVDNPVANPFKA